MAEAPAIDAAECQILMTIAKMAKLPVENGCKAVRIGHQVSHAEIAVEEDGRGRVGQMILKPFDRQSEDRAVAAIAGEARFEFGDHCLGIACGQVREIGGGDRMDAGQFAGNVGDQRRWWIAKDIGRTDVGLNPPHHIAAAKLVTGHQFPDYLRCQHACLPRRANNRGFDVMTERPAFHDFGRRCAAQDIARAAPVK